MTMDIANPTQSIAAFLIARGDYWWLGQGSSPKKKRQKKKDLLFGLSISECICVKQRKKDTDRQTDRQTDRETGKQRTRGNSEMFNYLFTYSSPFSQGWQGCWSTPPDRFYTPLFNTDTGKPTGPCFASAIDGVFMRQYEKGNAVIDCGSFTAQLNF